MLMSPPFKNREKRTTLVWAVITLVCLGLCFLPAAVDMDMMRGGYGLIVISAFLALTGAIVVATFWRRAARLDALVHGKDLLAHWTYSPTEWQRFVEVDYGEERSEKRALFMVVAGFSVLIGAGFLIFVRDGGLAVFLVMIALVAVISVFAFLLPWVKYRRKLRTVGEVFLSPTAAYVGGAFHSWTMLGAALESARFRQGSPAIVEIVYSAPTRQGRQDYTLRVPVPAGMEDAAARVVETLRQTAERNE